MKGIGACTGLILLSGCLTSDGLSTMAQSDVNVSNLSRISVGMNEGEVMQKMHPPHSEETYTIGPDQYDVWFYVTNPTILGQTKMVHFNLTPLTFKNDVLVATGWDYYKYIKEKNRRINQQVAPQTPPAPPGPETNQELYEKVLESPPAAETQSGQEGASAPAKDENLEQILEAPSPPSKTEEVPPAPASTEVKPAAPAEPKRCPGLLEVGAWQNRKLPSFLVENEKEESETPAKKTPTPLLDEEDEDRLQEEQEQDFNFW